MPRAPADRQLLGPAGLSLDEDAYARAVAAAGGTTATWRSTAWGPQPCVRWTAKTFARRTRRGTRPAGAAALRGLAAAWPPRVAADGSAPLPARVLLHAGGEGPGEPDLVGVARVLAVSGAVAESVVVELNAPAADLKWQWPPRTAALPGDAEAFGVPPLTREAGRCEFLLARGSVRRALRLVLSIAHRVRAAHVIVCGPLDLPWVAMEANLDALLAETQAAAVSVVAAPPAATRGVLDTLVAGLSRNVPYDVALARAFASCAALHAIDLRLVDAAALTTVAARLGRRLEQLPAGAALDLPMGAPGAAALESAHGPADLARAITEHATDVLGGPSPGDSLGEVARAERTAHLAATAAEAPRVLQGRLLAASRGALRAETRGMVVGREYALDVFIGPREADALGAAAFPDADVDWNGEDRIRLQVLLVEPGQWPDPIAGTLSLPRTGRSTTCRLAFSPTRPGPFAGRVILHHRGRALQTATLRATVVPDAASRRSIPHAAAPRLAVEAHLRRSLGALDERRRFDACLVTNPALEGAPALAAAAAQGAYLASLGALAPQLSAINGLLNQVALDAAPYQGGLLTPANAELLGRLAAHGNVLYRRLVLDHIDRSTAARALRSSEYLQIVSTDPDALVPFEFVYEYRPPGDGAPVCPNAIQALREGRCPASCVPQRSPAPHVCPLGFWGLSRVIERHLHVPDLPHPALVLAEPVAGRDELPLTGPSLLAASRQVPAASRQELLSAMQSVWGGRVASVDTWEAWQRAVASSSPVLLLAMPHADGAGPDISLEIDGDVLRSIDLDESYVRASAAVLPVVVLLGCDTTNVADASAYTRHVGIFRQAQAALVLGTVATVLAADAARVATQLVRHIGEATGRSPERFGEILRQVKRDAVADSLMTALCIVAFGDADWRLRWR